MSKKQLVKRWFLFCEPCSYKQIITADKCESDTLVEIKTSPIPGGAPRLDPKTKKGKDRPSIQRNKKFKCPQCGRGVTAKSLPPVYVNAFKEVDELKRKEHDELEKKKRIEDGKPVKHEKDPDFLG